MSKVKILLVEDEADVAEGIQAILEDQGYSVPDVIAYGEEAIEKAGETCPDLVLMDILLKGAMDGIEAAKHIHDRFNIPVIYLTGYADEEKLQQAKLTEPYGYILKPFNAQELHATIEMALYKRNLENELRSKFSTVLRSIGDAVITIDKKGFITFMNPVAEALTGWKQEVAQGKALVEVFDIKDKDKIISIKSSSMKALFRGDIDSLTNESILISGGKKEIPNVILFYIEFNVAAIRDDKGIISGFVLVFRNITERKHTEQELKITNKRLAMLAETVASMKEYVSITDKEHKIIFTNKAFLNAYGFNEEEVLGKTVDFIFSPNNPKNLRKKIRSSTMQGSWKGELFNIKKDGTEFPIELSTSTLKDDKGEIIAYIGVSADITERKLVEKALLESEEKYRTMFDNVYDQIVYVSKYGTITAANDREKIFGRKPEEMIGKKFTKLGYFNVKDIPKMLNHFKDIITGRKKIDRLEMEVKHKDGHKIPVEISTRVVKKGGRMDGFLCMIRDITERKRAEAQRAAALEELQESEEKYRLIVEISKDAIVISQKDKFIFFNKAFADLLGYSKVELMFKDYSDVYTEKGMEILMARKEHREREEDVPSLYETLFRKKDGSEINVEANVTIIDYKGEKATFAVIRDITEQKKLLATLKESLEKTKGLEGLIPICASCKKIRDEDKEEKPWVFPEKYIMERLPNVGFTHGICPECVKKLYPEYYDKIFSNKSKNDEIGKDL